MALKFVREFSPLELFFCIWMDAKLKELAKRESETKIQSDKNSFHDASVCTTQTHTNCGEGTPADGRKVWRLLSTQNHSHNARCPIVPTEAIRDKHKYKIRRSGSFGGSRDTWIPMIELLYKLQRFQKWNTNCIVHRNVKHKAIWCILFRQSFSHLCKTLTLDPFLK